MELREQLQRTLGNAYVIERELGGGGMSRVFVAVERALGRHVVIKVLPSELAAGVSIERFRREITIAAQLQHPHIVPLLAAGHIGELPYFTMPFVRGESLRTKLSGGELPVSEAVRILREVASALAFAHDQGVVHRDLKPDNVLLAGDVAVVTDFGVAKALSASTDADAASSLTSFGIALGTPAYMSPEQASADPHVDHRADIYAFGCTAYELLCGHSPFAGRAPQSMLAAHLNQEPEHILKRRPSVPPALASLVMRCLEKRAADRPQNAHEIVITLDQLTTPSAGMIPAAATRRLTITTGVAALAIVALLVYVAVNARSSSSPPAAVGKSVAVLPFINVGGDTANEFFADGMADDLASALGKVPGLRVAARSSAFALKGKNIEARDAGGRLKVATVVEGTVRRSGSRLKVTAQLINVADGLTLWSDSFEGDTKDVFRVQDEITGAIVGSLQIALGASAQSRLVSRGTDNIEAHELYLKGRFYTNRFTKPDLQRSLDLYQAALAKDSNYALPYTGIADALINLADAWIAPKDAYPRAKEAARRALQIDESLAEAHTALGTILMWFDRDRTGAERELRRAIQLNPSYARAHLYYGWFLYHTGNSDSAIALLRLAHNLDPLAPRIPAIASVILADAGRLDEAEEQCAKALALDATHPLGRMCSGRIDESRQRLHEARTSYIVARDGGWLPAAGRLAVVEAKLNNRAAARRIARELEERAGRQYVRGEAVALAHLAAGDTNSVFRWLERTAQDRGAGAISIVSDPVWAPIRFDPQFISLLKQLDWNR